MRIRLKFFLPFTLLLIWVACMNHEKASPLHIDHYVNFKSDYVASRNIEVMLPPGYIKEETKQYDVIYMHDGQNIFDAKTSYAGVAWQVDKAIVKLLEKAEIRPAIIVAIWNSPLRMNEYMPAQPLSLVREKADREGWDGELLSDNYLKFIVKELKPFIDSTYNASTKREHTFIMGSSMGALISLYALAEYPEVFGGAACISTHWPALNGVFMDYVNSNLPEPGNHKLYFDFGTETLDSLYEPYQLKVDNILTEKGYINEKHRITLKFEGADHSEESWQERVHIPLMFFLEK